MTYIELITLLKDTSLKHQQVNSVGNGRESEFDEADNQQYPAVHFVSIAPSRSMPTNGAFTRTYTVLMLVGDLLHEKDLEDSTIADHLNKTDRIVEELLLRWKITEGLRIDNVESEEFIDKFAAGLTGWAVRFDIIFKENPSTCDLPFTDL